MVAYYAFENNTEDSSGNGLHGTVAGNPIYAEGLATAWQWILTEMATTSTAGRIRLLISPTKSLSPHGQI